MNDVRLAKFAKQQRPVGDLRRDRPQVFDAHRPTEWPWRLRVHWDEPGVDVWIVLPRREEPVGLHRLAPENPNRWRDQRYLKFSLPERS